MKKSITSTIILGLTACASDPIDPLDPTVGDLKARQPQCPIGYKPKYSKEVVIKSGDKNKKTGQTTEGFRCEPE